jgi:hypothetical protein
MKEDELVERLFIPFTNLKGADYLVDLVVEGRI